MPLTEVLDILRETEEPCRQVGAVVVVFVDIVHTIVLIVVVVLSVIVLFWDRDPRRNAEAEVKLELLERGVWKEVLLVLGQLE